jgi:cytochrome c biogenesis protein CcmG, thiol:disulfide interchange protein DsbE
VTRARWSIIIVIVALVGAGWIFVNRLPLDAASSAGALPPAPTIGHPAPDFTLTGLDGKTFTLSELRGQPVVLNFWATWCPPCRAEMPELQAASERLDGEVAIIGVNQGENAQQVSGFVQPLGFTFPMPLDESMGVSRQYLVRNLPTTFFIDRDGIIRHAQVGPLTEATLAQRLKTVYP